MSLEAALGRRSVSPASSGRSTPVPRASRRAEEDGAAHKGDKTFRKYAVIIERTLSSWEISPEEWADYIAFLGRLLKAIQSHPKDVATLPHSASVASKLSQCMNPALPSGVHQKALEVYSYIFSTFGRHFVSSHLDDFFPGLSAVLSFASLSVRPALYDILEEHILPLSPPDLRPLLKALVLSLLPALEDETSEDFERAYRSLETLERKFTQAVEGPTSGDRSGFFWQCLFLAIITSPQRRQGALNFLVHKLPKFESSSALDQNGRGTALDGSDANAPIDAEIVTYPEPGLLIRAFVCGLSDPQLLVQRGFLDLLVTHLPLSCTLLQKRIRQDDLDRLVNSAMHVLLRREMSLNRRLWSWFLGPEVKGDAQESQPSSPVLQKNETSSQLQYFVSYGKSALQRSVLAMFARGYATAAERARPFRLCLSLMDRWEIGGSIVPAMFMPAIESAFKYSQEASAADAADLTRSASLFFDSIEPSLIWSNIIQLLESTFHHLSDGTRPLALCKWIVQNFNIKDEEMVTSHIPRCVTFISLRIESSHDIAQAHSVALLGIASLLMAPLPDRALPLGRAPTSKDEAQKAASETVPSHETILHSYTAQQPSQSDLEGSRPEAVTLALYQAATSLTLRLLQQEEELQFAQVTSLLVDLQSKAPSLAVLQSCQLLPEMLTHLRRRPSTSSPLAFPIMANLMSLVAAMRSNPTTAPHAPDTRLAELESMLTPEIWQYLSPSRAKFHVEASRMLWQVHDIAPESHALQATLTALVLRAPLDKHANAEQDAAEAARRFAVLWTHSVSGGPTPSSQRGPSGFVRRASAMPGLDVRQSIVRREVLTEPLMVILDALSEPYSPSHAAVLSWLQSLPTLEQVFTIHFDALETLLHASSANDPDEAATSRHDVATVRSLEYLMSHCASILRHRNEWVSQCLADMTLSDGRQHQVVSGLERLAQYCMRLLCDGRYASRKLERTTIEILGLALSGPDLTLLKHLDLDAVLIDKLTEGLNQSWTESQSALLTLITEALKLRLTPETGRADSVPPRSRSSISSKRPSSTGLMSLQNGSTTSQTPSPPPKLLFLLKAGFGAESARLHLDKWLEFLSNVLPVFSDAIFAGLIPLVEGLCAELNRAYSELVGMTLVEAEGTAVSPEATVMALLEAMEMVLARAHRCLESEAQQEPEQRPVNQTRGLFGNTTSGAFKAEGPPSRTAYANSRLTVVLTFQDAIRVSLRLWIWASHSTEVDAFDANSASTTSYNALRVRNRTRHLLEQIFAVEPLESLEVVMFAWRHEQKASQATASIDLLHVLQGTRPKNVIPAILDSLCSRTNPSVLPENRLSTQSTDLTALDTAAFLSAYLQSTEDDALDEVWPDCMAFLRDVLGNPLPYRQVLPALLMTIRLLAQKLENTNFGEQRKMRKELSDSFNRLLTATFTTMPSGYIQDPKSPGDQWHNNEGGRGALIRTSASLISALKEVTAQIEVILETSERAVSAMNSITTSLVGPMLRAKSFPSNITPETLELILQVTKKAPYAKPWKKELLDALNDARLLTVEPQAMVDYWFPVLCQWCLHDKERIPELLSRLAPPSSAGIMFGVGANAARLEADRKSQLNLRRVSILLLACPEDTFALHLRVFNEKLAELFDATASSSPSATVKSELFMLCRAIVLSTSSVQLAPMWPVINANLHAALASLLPNAANDTRIPNLALLQACKLLDLLVVLSPDEFQLHEWLYVTDTIDAVYQPTSWDPSALSDQIATVMAAGGAEDDAAGLVPPTPIAHAPSGQRRPLLDGSSMASRDDFKAMAQEDFAHTVLRPFLSQLSMYAYEAVYGLSTADLDACRRNLLDDLLDLKTIVE